MQGYIANQWFHNLHPERLVFDTSSQALDRVWREYGGGADLAWFALVDFPQINERRAILLVSPNNFPNSTDLKQLEEEQSWNRARILGWYEVSWTLARPHLTVVTDRLAITKPYPFSVLFPCLTVMDTAKKKKTESWRWFLDGDQLAIHIGWSENDWTYNIKLEWRNVEPNPGLQIIAEARGKNGKATASSVTTISLDLTEEQRLEELESQLNRLLENLPKVATYLTTYRRTRRGNI